MRIEELSVGDWVAFGGKKYRIKIIDSPYHSVTLWGNNEQREESVELISPIPLTVGILEKNGLEFIDDGNDAIIFLCCDMFWAKLCVGDCFWSIGVHSEDRLDAVMCDVKYVHQLQHALRLARVEKEVVL